MSQPYADRNLLFGILALQMEFIDRDALVAAMNAWVLDKSKALGEFLVAQQALAPRRRALLESLVEEHLNQHGGDPEKSLAAIRSASLAAEKLDQITDAELKGPLARTLGEPLLSASQPAGGTVRYQPAKSSGARFVILRPHAKGGLGEVFVALDEELNREVALKAIQSRHTDDPISRTRFVQEAEITGRLEHPAIVPVYGFGEQKDGRPYYAMRFIKGESLREAIRGFHQAKHASAGQRSLELRKLLGAFLAVCQAIHYAHSRGILHRDLKPGNIMLGKFGETLVVDWGLAKPMDQLVTEAEASQPSRAEAPLKPLSGSGSVQTLTGAAVGTPGYMSPEQAAGRLDLLTPASDVYSLGATLYCMLTGKGPFTGPETAEVLRRVQQGAFVPPRAVDARIAPALEAICLKAMAQEPQRRYASARELAEDVEHWLADEPVEAHPEPLGMRLARWARHHKPLVAGAAALLITAVVALSLGLVLLGQAKTRIQEQRDRAEENFDEAQRQRQQAVTHLYHSRIGEARALREARGYGYRGKAWNLLHQALQLDTPEKDVDQLRQEAVAWMGEYVGLEPATWEGLEPEIKLLELQPHGVQLALGLDDGSVLLRNIDTGAEIARLREPGSGITALHFGPDGKRLVTGDSRGVLRVWETGKNGRWACVTTFHPEARVVGLVPSPAFPFVSPWLASSPGPVTALALADGKHLAACYDNGPKVVMWNLADGTQGAPFRGRGRERFLCLAFSPQANLLAAGFGQDGRYGSLVWDVATRQLKPVILPSIDPVNQVLFSPDGRFLAASCGDGGTVLFDTADWQRRLYVAGYNPVGLAFSPDSQLLAIPSIHFGVVRLWNVTTNREVAVLSHPGDPRWAVFRTDGKALVTAHPRSVRIWNLAGGGEKLVLSGHEGGVPGIAFSPDGKLLASVGKDRKATIWDPTTGQALHTLIGFGGVLHAVAFSPDGRLLATGDRAGAIRFWEVGSWQELAAPLHEIGPEIWSVAFSPDGKYFAACGLPGGVVLWHVGFRPASAGKKAELSLEKLARLSDRPAQFLCFNTDSNLLAWCSDSTAHFWDLKKSQPHPSPPAQVLSPLSSLAFRPDGKQVALIGPALVPEVLDVATGQKVFSAAGAESPGRRYPSIASVIALTADGSWLAQQGPAVKVWDLDSRKLLLVLPEEHATAWSLAWSPNKELLAVGSEHGGIAVWNLPQMRAQLDRIGLGW